MSATGTVVSGRCSGRSGSCRRDPGARDLQGDDIMEVSRMLPVRTAAVGHPCTGRKTRGAPGMRARCLVAGGAVLMLMMRSCLAADVTSEDLDLMRPPNSAPGPHPSSRTSWTGNQNGEDNTMDPKPGPDPSPGPRLGPWPEGKVFAEATTSVWTETGADALTGSDAWTEAGVEWQSEVSGEPAVKWLRMNGVGGGKQGAFSSVLAMLAETAEPKPIALLSKAAWTKSSSSSSPKAPPLSTVGTSTAPPPTTPAYNASSLMTASHDRSSPVNESFYASSNISEELVRNPPAWDLPTVPESLLSTVGDHDITLPANVTSPFSTHQWNTTVPAHTRNTSRPAVMSTTPTHVTNTTAPTTTRAATVSTLPFSTVTGAQMAVDSTTGRSHVTDKTVTVAAATPTLIGQLLSSVAGTTVPNSSTVTMTALGNSPEAATANLATSTTTTTFAPHSITTITTTSTTSTSDPPTTTTITSTTPPSPPTTTTLPTVTPTKPPSTTLFIPMETKPSTTQPPSSTSAEDGPPPCTVTQKLWVRTVLSIELRKISLDLILKQNLSRGLSLALQGALNDSSAGAQVEHEDVSPHNVTLGYYVTSGKSVYISSLVVDALNIYGFDKLLADVKRHAPPVTAVLLPVAPWLPPPRVHLQLRTVLRFVGPMDQIFSCSFVQMLESRLENAFEEAQDKVLETYDRLTVEVLSVSQQPDSPSVSLVYIVKTHDSVLNGTVSSELLNQLTAELVGYFLFYPPLVIAEPLQYYNLNTSIETKIYWVKTVIQDVDGSSLENNYQTFASIMEQRLAELFLVAGRQSVGVARARRAATVGGYTVQMVSMRRLPGPKNSAELTYYAQLNSAPIPGTAAAKTLSSLDSQTMALTLGYFVQVQAEPVIKMAPNNLWIMAILTPLFLLLVVIGMVAFIICKRNKISFKSGAFRSFRRRSKASYRREASYHHQPVQGFDYAKKHMGRPGDDTVSITKETLALGLSVRDAPLLVSLDKKVPHDATSSKRPPSTDVQNTGRLPSDEDGSVSSNSSGKLNTSKTSSGRRATPGSKNTKEEQRKDDSASLRLIANKPLTLQPAFSYPSSSSHSQDSVIGNSAIANGETNAIGLKQKSDIERYRNRLRQKARRKGYGEFSLSENGGQVHCDNRHTHHNGGSKEPMTAEEKRASFAGCHKRYSQPREAPYWSRQSLSSPSPVETEMDLLVLRDRSRRGIRNNGYDGEPEPCEETDVDRLMTSLSYGGGGSKGTGSLGVKGHRGSDSSTLSSQPSIDEVRTQMHALLGNAFSLALPDRDLPSPLTGRHRHHQHRRQHAQGAYNLSHTSHYSDGVTSAPGTMNHPCGGRQRSAAYEDLHQCSLPKPGFRFTQLPDMGIGAPPTLIPSRAGVPLGTSLRCSTPDISLKPRGSESLDLQPQQHNGAPYLPLSRTPFPAVTVDQTLSSYSGNPITAVYAISANRPGYSDYFVMSPPSSYRSPSWMSYPPEPEDLPPWNDTPLNSRHLETIC